MTESHYTKRVRDKVFGIKKRKNGSKTKTQTQRAPVLPPRPVRRRGLGDYESSASPEPRDHTATNKRKAEEECKLGQDRVKRTKTNAPTKKITAVIEKPRTGILQFMYSSALKLPANKRKLEDDLVPARKKPLTEEGRRVFQRSVGFKGDPRPTRECQNPWSEAEQKLTKDESEDKAWAKVTVAAPETKKTSRAPTTTPKQIKAVAAITSASPAEASSAFKRGFAQPVTGRKRKLDDSPELPSKKKQRACVQSVQEETTKVSRRKTSKPSDNGSKTPRPCSRESVPPTMINRSYFCFMNSALHLLGNVPELAAIEVQGQADDLLSKSPFTKDDLIQATRKTRGCEDKREKIRDYLQDCGDDLRRAFMSELTSMLKATTSGSDKLVDPTVFSSFCGALLSTARGAYFDGQTQEDVSEFVQAMTNQVQISGEMPLVQKLFGIEFEQTMTCDGCDKEKTFKVDDDDAFRLGIPKAAQQSGAAVNMSTLVEHFVNDTAKFEQYECEACREAGKVGRMVAREGQGVKLVTIAPDYLMAPITRAGQVTRGYESFDVKLDTSIVPSTKPIRLRTSTGTHVEYELLGFAEHHGHSFESGHYAAIRQMNGKWFHCDDAGRNGVTELSVKEIEHYDQATFCLLKKVSASTTPEL